MLIIAGKMTILTVVGIIAFALCVIAVSAASVSFNSRQPAMRYETPIKNDEKKEGEVKEG